MQKSYRTKLTETLLWTTMGETNTVAPLGMVISSRKKFKKWNKIGRLTLIYRLKIAKKGSKNVKN